MIHHVLKGKLIKKHGTFWTIQTNSRYTILKYLVIPEAQFNVKPIMNRIVTLVQKTNKTKSSKFWFVHSSKSRFKVK